MSKSDRIRQYMGFAYCGGMYHRGIVAREREYIYFLDSVGNIERCNVRLYDAGCPIWEVWATYTSVIRALSGHNVAIDCTGTAVESSPWDVYVDKYGAAPICVI